LKEDFMQKRLLVLAILLAAVTAMAGAQQTIKIGFWDNAPFVVGQPGGKPPVGAAIDYWNTCLAPAMNVKVEWVGPTALPRLLSQLQSGDIDAVLIVGKNPDREKLYLFPALPYLSFQPGLAVLKDYPRDAIKTADDVAGMKIGYANGLLVVDFLKNSKATWDNLSTATWIQDNYAKLANKRVDAVFNLGIAGLQYEASKTYAGKFKFLTLPVAPSPIYSAFAKTDRGTAFLKLYNDANAKNASAVDALVKKYTN
jgi:ABC-type amino acid transport substrate-binding protein